MIENLTVNSDRVPFVAVANDEICRVNADGTATYHWDRIEAAAQRWDPGCVNIAICLAKLLLPLRPHAEPEPPPEPLFAEKIRAEFRDIDRHTLPGETAAEDWFTAGVRYAERQHEIV